MIEFKDVTFGYTNINFLENLNLKIYDGDFVGIVGPNGGGKTTVLKLILGLLKPKNGKVKVFGQSPKKNVDRIGYLSQYKDIDFYFPITVFDMVKLSLIKKNPVKFFTKKDKQKVEEILDFLDLKKYRDKNLHELSGGEKQRVFIARAIVSEPDVIVMDEPAANVDIKVQNDLYSILETLNRDKNMTIIVVDHNIEELMKHVKHVVCINKCDFHGAVDHSIVFKDKKVSLV